MSRKNFNLKFSYDAPVSQTFVIITVAIFLLDLLVFKLKLNTSYLIAPTSAAGNLPFSLKEPLSWVRLLFYIFGGTDKALLFTNLLFVILIGPTMEERYGSIIIGLMFFVSAMFTGVLNVCACKFGISGCSSVVFMLLILNALMFFTKKTVSATSITMILLFVCREFFIQNPNGIAGTLITLAGGLCGSLFAFIASPKARAAKKNNSGLLSRAEQIKRIDEESPRNKKTSSSSSSDKTVEIGTLKF